MYIIAKELYFMDNLYMNFRTLSEIWFDENSYDMCYTYKNSLFSLTQHANRKFGDKNITEIRPLDITDLVKELAIENPNTHKPASKKTLQTLVTTLYRIFDMAIDNDWLIKNPAKNKFKLIPKNAPKREVTAISKSEQLAIVSTPHRCQIAALIMMFLGLRTGELLALEWSDIDLIGKRAHIHKRTSKISGNKYITKEGTKSNRGRYVTIPDNMCAYLAVQKQQATSNYVFPKADGEMNTPSSFQSAWKSYLNTLNFEEYKRNYNEDFSKFDPKGYPKNIRIRPHQLRHTYATLLYVSDTDILTASKLLGHSSVQFTLDTYTHLDAEYKTLDISNFNEYLETDLCNFKG